MPARSYQSVATNHLHCLRPTGPPAWSALPPRTHWRRPDLRREVVMPAKPEPRGRAEGYPVQRRHLRPAGRAFPQSGKRGRQLLPSGAVAGGP